MRLTTKGTFCRHRHDRPRPRGKRAPVTWRRQRAAEDFLSHLEQLFGKLRRLAEDSVRGPGGGYCIARPLDQVSVADIIRAVDEPPTPPSAAAGELPGRTPVHDPRPVGHPQPKMYDYLTFGFPGRSGRCSARTTKACYRERWSSPTSARPRPRPRSTWEKAAVTA